MKGSGHVMTTMVVVTRSLKHASFQSMMSNFRSCTNINASIGRTALPFWRSELEAVITDDQIGSSPALPARLVMGTLRCTARTYSVGPQLVPQTPTRDPQQFSGAQLVSLGVIQKLQK